MVGRGAWSAALQADGRAVLEAWKAFEDRLAMERERDASFLAAKCRRMVFLALRKAHLYVCWGGGVRDAMPCFW